MATSWFIVPYVTTIPGRIGYASRTLALLTDPAKGTFTFKESEILGNRAVVKVRAEPAVLVDLGTRYRRLPKSLLTEPLSDLTASQLQIIRQEALDAGYSLEEIQQRFPNIANATLGDVLRFMASRRVPPRWDGQAVVYDLAPVKCEDVDEVDKF